jgi:hypothetical protein
VKNLVGSLKIRTVDMLKFLSEAIQKKSCCFLALWLLNACTIVDTPKIQQIPRQFQNFDRNLSEIDSKQLTIPNVDLDLLKSQIAEACISSGLTIAFEVEGSQRPLIVGCQISIESRSAIMFELMLEENAVNLTAWWPKALMVQSTSLLQILGAPND